MGQVLASRPDIVREDYMNELCVLQDDVPSFPDVLVGRFTVLPHTPAARLLLKASDWHLTADALFLISCQGCLALVIFDSI